MLRTSVHGWRPQTLRSLLAGLFVLSGFFVLLSLSDTTSAAPPKSGAKDAKDAKAKEENGKTPSDMATELNKVDVWRSALREAGRRRDGEPRVTLFDEVCF